MNPLENLEYITKYLINILQVRYQDAIGDHVVKDEVESGRIQRETIREVLRISTVFESVQKTLFTMQREVGLLPTNCSTEKSPYELPENTDPYILKVIEVDTDEERKRIIDTYIEVDNAGTRDAARSPDPSSKESS